MCDEGMLDYARIHKRRVLDARIAGKTATLDAALSRAAKLLKGVVADNIAVVLSAEHSNEDNFALLSLARDYLGTGHLFVTGRPAGEGDDILRHRDKNPNMAGVTALCTSTPLLSMPVLLKSLDEGRITHVVALGSAIPDPDKVEGLRKAKALIALSTHVGPLEKTASVVLPAASWAECDGTFVNAKGLAQESERAVFPQGNSVPAWKLVSMLARALGHEMEMSKLTQVRRAMAPDAGAALEGNQASVGATP
jgi:NADH-quinone oxidoreductase subunit G